MVDTSRFLRATLCLGVAASLFGCPSDPETPKNQPAPLRPITTTNALATANANVRRLTVGLAESGGFLESSDFLSGLFQTDDLRAPCDPEGNCGEPIDQPSIDERAGEMADMIAERILTEANLERAEEKMIVLALKGDVVCMRTVATTDGATEEVLDEDCAARLAANPIRIELTSRREGDIDAALEIGTAQPIVLALYAKSLAMTIDIAAALDAAKTIATIAGETFEAPAGQFSGQVRFELKENGALDHTLAMSVTSPVRVSMMIEGEALRFELGASSPLYSLRFNGNTQVLTAESKAGPMDMTLPLGVLGGGEVNCTVDENGMTICSDPEPILDATVDVHVPGSGSTITIDGSDTIKMSALMDGATTIHVDGIEVFRAEMNAQNGRRLEAELTGSETGFVLAVQPLLDLVMDFDMASLTDQMDVPAELASDSIRVRLDGDSQPAIRFAAIEAAPAPSEGDPAPTTNASMFEVLRGRFTISSRAASQEVVVEAGQCLTAVEVNAEENETPGLLDFIAAGACN